MAITSFNYTPGDSTAIVAWPVCALVRLPPWDPLVGWAYAALTNDPTPETLIREFVDSAPGSQPAIGVLSVEPAGVRVMAQGQVRAFIGGEKLVCPPDGTIVDEQSPVLLMADGAADGPGLPLAYGIVAAGRVGVGWSPDGAADWQVSAGRLDSAPLFESGVQAIGRPQVATRTDLVTAVLCPYGHANPVFASRCRVCQSTLTAQSASQVPRQSLGVLRSSSGLVVPLDGAVILGRNPQPIGNLPQARLVTIADPGLDVSGRHLAVEVNDWIVSVTDLGSTNGTQVITPGHPPVTLRAHEPTVIEPGTVVVLAHVFDFVYEAQ